VYILSDTLGSQSFLHARNSHLFEHSKPQIKLFIQSPITVVWLHRDQAVARLYEIYFISSLKSCLWQWPALGASEEGSKQTKQNL